jgi:hypothetical protein
MRAVYVLIATVWISAPAFAQSDRDEVDAGDSSGNVDVAGGDAGDASADAGDAAEDASDAPDAGDAGDDGGYDAGDAGSGCPHKGRGCDALLWQLNWDFDRYWLQEYYGLYLQLVNNGCHLHTYDVRASGKVRPMPLRTVTRVITRAGSYEVENMSAAREAQLQAAWRADMNAEWIQMWATLRAHTADVRRGVDLAFEHVNAHGSPCAGANGEPEDSCGSWGGVGEHPDPGAVYINWYGPKRRQPEYESYQAAYDNACEQVFIDTSCYGKCTEVHGGNMNRAAMSTCMPAAENDPCNRAAWEFDVWIGSSRQTWGKAGVAYSDGVEEMRADVSRVLTQMRTAGHPHDLAAALTGVSFPAIYSDDGYGLYCPRN